jgi:GMP reductase
MFNKGYHYSDIFLVPKKTTVDSRKQCDTSVKFGNNTFKVPIYAANMKSVVDENTCEFFAKNNWFYTMHRFNVDPVKFTRDMHEKGLIASISIGVNEESYSQIDRLKEEKVIPDYITLDIANAFSDKAERMINYIKKHMPKSFLIAGNIATKAGTNFLISLGVDAIKAGIAGGKVCITKNKTGFHVPMVNTVIDCVDYAAHKNIPVIADGGITEHGDIAKALALGASMVMAGSLFAGYDQSAGNIVEINGRKYKEYFGSASEHNKGKYQNVEGKKILVDYKGDMKPLLQEIEEDLQSSISYAGGDNIKYLQALALNPANFISVK